MAQESGSRSELSTTPQKSQASFVTARSLSGCLAVMLTFFCKANTLNQLSLFNKAVGKRKHALESKQVLTDVCRRYKGHAL